MIKKMVLLVVVMVMVVSLACASEAQKCPYLTNNIDASSAQGSPITLAQQYQATEDCFITQVTLELFTSTFLSPSPDLSATLSHLLSRLSYDAGRARCCPVLVPPPRGPP
jgi:hypothetical protein